MPALVAMSEEEFLTAQERAAIVAWDLAQGRRMTTRQVATMTGLSMRGARALLSRMSRVIPIYRDGMHWVEAGEKREHSLMIK